MTAGRWWSTSETSAPTGPAWGWSKFRWVRPSPGGGTDAPQQKKTAEKGVEEEQLAIHHSDSWSLITDGTHSVLHVVSGCADVYHVLTSTRTRLKT